jgi:hypothetical protein
MLGLHEGETALHVLQQFKRSNGGKSDQLASILQQRYGFGRDQAEREIREFSRDSQT